MSIDHPRDSYSSREDFRSRTLALGSGDPDTKLYPHDNETLVWMKAVATAWCSKGAKPNVLEIGCGHGRWAKHLENFYETYVGIDPVSERIASAKNLYATGRAHFFAEPVPLTGGIYNSPTIIFAVDVLQHLGLNESLALMVRVSQLLPIGGHFYTWDGCLGDWSREECEAMYKTRPEHMIPKPLSYFRDAMSVLKWICVDGTRLIAERVR